MHQDFQGKLIAPSTDLMENASEDESEPTTTVKPMRVWLSGSELRRIAERNERNERNEPDPGDGEGSTEDASAD